MGGAGATASGGDAAVEATRVRDTPLQEHEAQPGTRIVHVHGPWKATIMRKEWPAVVVLFDEDIGRLEKLKKVWAGVFRVLGPEEEV